MLNSLLADISIGEAALYALIGFLVVFGGIAFLIFIVWLIGKAKAYLSGKPVVAPKQTQQKKVQAPAPVAAPVADTEEVPEEVVAVITAALMAYYKQAKPQCGFIVKRIKRI